MSWSARQPWWQRSPLAPEYYPLAEGSYPLLIENADVDWTPRAGLSMWSPRIQVGDSRYYPWQTMGTNEDGYYPWLP